MQNQAQWQRILLLTAFGLLFLGGNGWIRTLVIGPLEWYHPPLVENVRFQQGEADNASFTTDVIILLGGATGAKDYPRPAVSLGDAVDRIIYAAQLYHEGRAPLILLSGGRIGWMDPSDTSEAEEMAEILLMLGVPQDALVYEDRSRNTFENALYTRELFTTHQWNDALLVTSAYHMPRAVFLFRQQEIDVIPAPTDYFVVEKDWFFSGKYVQKDMSLPQFFLGLFPSVGNVDLTTRAIKEYIGLLIYTVRT
ncbi:MAG: YdcF family protein [Chloroflexota bacterium]